MGNKNSALNAKFKVREWQWQLKTELKSLDREIKKIQAGEAKLQREIAAQAEKGNVQSVQLLAKSVVRSRKAVQRLEKTKASMHAVDLQLTTSVATMTTASSLKLSADVMKQMNGIARIPDVGASMDQMRREMAAFAAAEDGIEEALRDDDEEEEAAVEVQKVLEEMALAKMGPLAATPATEAAPVAAPPVVVAAPPERQAVAVGCEEPTPAAQPPVIRPPEQKPAALAAQAPPTAPAAPVYAPTSLPATDAVPAAASSSASAAVAPPPAEDDDDLMRRLEMLKRN